MSLFKSIIKGDYLQRTRSYAFLVTLAISLYLAYTFLPAQGASYSTVKIGNYVGESNAAWIGYVTAIMTSIFLSLLGFYLVNNSIKKDIDTEVGMIIATTRISNFKYLLSKMLSNFLVLLSITGVVFMMGIVLFFIRSNGAPFDLVQFVLPYLLTTLPCIFFISSFAIFSEVFLGRWPALHYLGFFFFFGIVTANMLPGPASEIKMVLDPFGVKAVTMGLESFVQQHFDAKAAVSSIGFNFSGNQEIKTFLFKGMPWPALYILSRLLWVALSVALVFTASIYFNRFDSKVSMKVKKKKKNLLENIVTGNSIQDIKLSALPSISTDYGILPFIKTELLMLFRKGHKWFWLINIGGMIALIFTPINIAHQFILPVLWFLQVGRLGDLATKEKTNRIHYFTYASYKPIERLLPSQILAGIILVATLSAPLLIRYLISGDFMPVTYILAGAVFIVSLAVALGILTGGKKLFEILFFAITYCNLNNVPFADYFGALNNSSVYLSLMLLLNSGLFVTGFALRKYEIRHL